MRSALVLVRNVKMIHLYSVNIACSDNIARTNSSQYVFKNCKSPYGQIIAGVGLFVVEFCAYRQVYDFIFSISLLTLLRISNFAVFIWSI